MKIEKYYAEDGEFIEIDSLPISLPAWAHWATIAPSWNLPGMCELTAWEYEPRSDRVVDWELTRGQFMLCAVFPYPKMVAGEAKDCLWKLEDLDGQVVKIEKYYAEDGEFIEIDSLPISLPAWAHWATIEPSLNLPGMYELIAHKYEPKLWFESAWFNRGKMRVCGFFLYRKMVAGKLEDCLWKLEDLET